MMTIRFEVPIPPQLLSWPVHFLLYSKSYTPASSDAVLHFFFAEAEGNLHEDAVTHNLVELHDKAKVVEHGIADG